MNMWRERAETAEARVAELEAERDAADNVGPHDNRPVGINAARDRIEQEMLEAIQTREARYREPISWLLGVTDQGEPTEVIPPPTKRRQGSAATMARFAAFGTARAALDEEGALFIVAYGRYAARAMAALDVARQVFEEHKTKGVEDGPNGGSGSLALVEEA